MTRAYVLDPVTRATLGLVDQSWERLSYVRRYTAMDTFELVINRTPAVGERAREQPPPVPARRGRPRVPHRADRERRRGEHAQRRDDRHRALARGDRDGRAPRRTAGGREPRPPDRGRRRDRDASTTSGPTPPTSPRRRGRCPGLVVAADAARGPTVTVNGRYQTVLDLVREIGLLAGLGWEITYDPGSGDFVFDVIEGVDRSASVFFDFAFETLERWEELDSVIDAKTVALVAGQGEGTARDLVTRWSGTEPTGFDRREAFLDARDVELGETTVLAQRGDALPRGHRRRDEPRGRRPPVRRLPLPRALGRRRRRHRAQRGAGLELPRADRRGREGLRAERRRADDHRDPRPPVPDAGVAGSERPRAPRPPTGR